MMLRSLSAYALIVAAACGGSGAPPASQAADTAAPTPSASASAPADAPAAPTLVIGGRYETQAGTIVCPQPAALQKVLDAGQNGDAASLTKALDDGHCSPVVAGAIVHVAEQAQGAARVRRTGDTTTYWTFANKLSPR